MISSWQHRIEFFWETDAIIWDSIWLYLPGGAKTKAPQYHPKLFWHQYWWKISYHQENHPRISGNKDNRGGKVSEVIFTSRHIIWKGNVHSYTYYFRIIEIQLKLTWVIPQSLGWWTCTHHFSSNLWYSIPYHDIKWIYKFYNRTCISLPHTWYVISHPSTSWIYNVFKI